MTHPPFRFGPALLFCPADRPDRFEKAAERADAVILDLEDAVADDAKRAARVALVGSTLVFKRLGTSEDLLAANALQLGAASIVLFPLTVLLEGAPRLVPSAEFTVSLAYLILVMSLGATFLWFWLLRHGEASRVSAFYFLTPIFGLGLGALLLGEPVRPLDGLGLAAVAAGIVLVQSARGRAVAPDATERSV